MLKAERQRSILERLERSRAVEVLELERQLGVSAFTIRRDLDELAAEGHLLRVHGGAVPRSPTNPSFERRAGEHLDSKRRVAAAALSLLEPDATVIIDGGSTALLLAESIPTEQTGTFLTHSPTVAVALGRLERSEVVCIPGTLDRRAMVCVGARTVEAYQGLHADLCFMGVWSAHAEHGLSERFHAEAEVRRALLSAADRIVGLCTADKLGTLATFPIGPASALTHMAVDPETPPGLLEPFAELGVQLLS